MSVRDENFIRFLRAISVCITADPIQVLVKTRLNTYQEQHAVSSATDR